MEGRGREPLNESDTLDVFTSALSSLGAEEGSPFSQSILEAFGEENGKNKGVSQEVIDSLERVALKDIPEKDTADCPICTNKFTDNDYPLIVKLPCHLKKGGKQHVFDLECIGPWLEMNSTCPLCRFDVLAIDKLRRENLEEELRKAREEDEESEEEGWDNYG